MRKVMTTVLALAAVAGAATATAQPWERERGRGGFGVQGGELVLYEHNWFNGREVVLRGPEPNLTGLRFNDAASSLRARGQWEVCEHVNFQGRCRRVDREEAGFDRSWNDTISSARPIGGGGGWDGDRPGRPERPDRPGGWGRPERGDGGLVLFEHAGFGGRALEIGDSEPDLNRYGFNDAASSIRVGRGTWRICEHAYFQGTCLVVQTDLGDLNQLRMNDRVSSIQRIG